MQPIVMDASTLILLAKIGLLEAFLRAWKGPVVVTPTVAREAWGQKQSPEVAELARRAAVGDLQVQAIEDRRRCRKLQVDFSLGPGEAETIWLASRRPKAMVASDDRMAIRACRALGMPWASALSILIWMRERHTLSAEVARGFLQELTVRGRYHHTLIEDARRRLEGRSHEQTPTDAEHSP